MKLIGRLNVADEITKIYTRSDGMYYDKDGTLITRETMEYFALCLNSPWDDTSCTIKSVKRIDSEYCATTAVICYDFIDVEAYGYGRTKESAEHNCDELIRTIQKKYNKNDMAF